MLPVFETVCEFGVEWSRPQGQSGLELAGRCFKGTIRAGASFDLRFRYVPVNPSEPYGEKKSEREELVQIEVEAVEMYGKLVDFVDPVYTALLRCRLARGLSRPLDAGDVLAQTKRKPPT